MENQTTFTVAGIVIALSAAIGITLAVVDGGNVRICDSSQVCQDFTQQQYDEVREDLATKIRNNTPLNLEEFHLAIAMISRELQPKTILSGVHDQDDLREKVADVLEN